MTDWFSLGAVGISTFAAGMSALSAKQSAEMGRSMFELERERDEEQRREQLRPEFHTALMAINPAAPAALYVRLDAPHLLAEEFDSLRVWVIMQDSQIPNGLLDGLTPEERSQEHQFWSPWEFDAHKERTRLESTTHELELYDDFVAELRPTPRTTALYDDEHWGRRLFAAPLRITIAAKLGNQRPWFIPREVPWARTWE